MAPWKEGGSQPHTFTSRSPHRGKKTGRGVKGAQRTWTLTVSPPSRRWHNGWAHPPCRVDGGRTRWLAKGLHGVQRFSAQVSRPRKKQGTMPVRGAHAAFRGPCPPVGRAPAAGAPCGSRGSLRASPADASPLHNGPTLSLRAVCPQTQSSLLPDAKAPAAAPEPGTALTAAGQTRFPEVTGQRGWWGIGHTGTATSPTLPTLGLQWEGPENQEEESRRNKKGKTGDVEGGHVEKEKDGP